MADLVMRKRPAMHAGELGLFVDSQVFEDEFANIHQGTDITVEATQSRNPRQFRLFWALAGKIAKSGAMGDSDQRDVVDYLLMKCKHVKYITTNFRGGNETIPVPKSIRFASMDQTAFNRLFNRALYVVTTEILPHVPEGELRDEIEKMAGVSTPEPEPVRQRKPRPKPPEKVSVIPPAEAGLSAGEPSPADKPAPLPSPAAQVAGTVQAPIPTATDVETWKAHCKAWLDDMSADAGKTAEDVLALWGAERHLRNRCGVSTEDRAGLYAYMNQIAEMKRGGEHAAR